MGESPENKLLLEKSLKLAAYATAPLSSSSVLLDLDELEEQDITLELLLEEMEMFSGLARCGLDEFTDDFRKTVQQYNKSKDEPNESTKLANVAVTPVPSDTESNVPVLPTVKPEDQIKTHMGVTTYLFPFYIHRLSRLGEGLTKMAEICHRRFLSGEMSPELIDELRRIRLMVNKKNMRPPGLDPKVLDMTAGLPWEIPDLRLPPTASTVAPTPASVTGRSIRWKATAAELEPSSSEIKAQFSTAGSRRTQHRHPTGFAKFNLSQLREFDLEEEEEDDTVRFSARSGASSTSQFSAAKHADLAEEGSSSMRLRSQHSSFDESPPRVIEDEMADPNWKDNNRSEARQRRVRSRIPTGHPNMMKTALLARMSLEKLDDEVTKQNTEMNGRFGVN